MALWLGLLALSSPPDYKKCGTVELRAPDGLKGCTAFVAEFEELTVPQVDALERELRSPSSSIGFLSLRNKGFPRDSDAEKLLIAASANNRLSRGLDTIIWRVHAPLSAGAGAALAGAIRANAALKTVDLRETILGDEGMMAIADALAESPSVRDLLLSGTGMTGAAVPALAKVFDAKALDTVDLGDNRWGNVGATALAAALERHDGAMRNVVFNDHPQVVGDGEGRDALILVARKRLGELNLWTSRRESRRKMWANEDLSNDLKSEL